LHDELTGEAYAVIDGTEGRAHDARFQESRRPPAASSRYAGSAVPTFSAEPAAVLRRPSRKLCRLRFRFRAGKFSSLNFTVFTVFTARAGIRLPRILRADGENGENGEI